jgi:flagellar basal-body rod modification protein FlgD
MTVSNVASSATAANTAASSGDLSNALGTNSGLGETAFLQLLVAQMKNQDPLQPMDNTDFVAQLAQFSNLEQVMGINSRLDTLTAQNQGVANNAATQLVGQSVTVNGTTVTLDGSGGAVPIAFSQSAASSDTQVAISDANGNVVRTMDLGPQRAGLLNGDWNGMSDAGVLQPKGAYTITVTAKTSSGGSVDVSQNLTGKVQAVSFSGGATQLELDNGLTVPTSELMQVGSTTTTP